MARISASETRFSGRASDSHGEPQRQGFLRAQSGVGEHGGPRPRRLTTDTSIPRGVDQHPHPISAQPSANGGDQEQSARGCEI
jgi:hypothetical protein